MTRQGEVITVEPEKNRIFTLSLLAKLLVPSHVGGMQEHRTTTQTLESVKITGLVYLFSLKANKKGFKH